MMTPPTPIAATTDALRPDLHRPDHVSPGSSTAALQDESSFGFDTLIDGLQTFVAQGHASASQDGSLDEPYDGSTFDPDEMFDLPPRLPRKAARLLREQAYLDRRSETITGLSNVVQSIKESIRTLIQDH